MTTTTKPSGDLCLGCIDTHAGAEPLRHICGIEMLKRIFPEPMENSKPMTKPSAFTAGPWHRRGRDIFAYNEDGTMVIVAAAGYSPANRSQQEQEANADLIASAPDLLRQINELENKVARLQHITGNEPLCNYDHNTLIRYGSPCPECGTVEGSDMK